MLRPPNTYNELKSCLVFSFASIYIFYLVCESSFLIVIQMLSMSEVWYVCIPLHQTFGQLDRETISILIFHSFLLFVWQLCSLQISKRMKFHYFSAFQSSRWQILLLLICYSLPFHSDIIFFFIDICSDEYVTMNKHTYTLHIHNWSLVIFSSHNSFCPFLIESTDRCPMYE